MPSSPTHTFWKTNFLWVAGSTHIVLLPKNAILGKECEEEENNSLTYIKWTFLLDWNFFWTTMTSEIESRLLTNRFDCTKMSKKNLGYHSRASLIEISNVYVSACYLAKTLLEWCSWLSSPFKVWGWCFWKLKNVTTTIQNINKMECYKSLLVGKLCFFLWSTLLLLPWLKISACTFPAWNYCLLAQPT